VWWYTPVIPALGKLRQEDHELEVSLCNVVRPPSQRILKNDLLSIHCSKGPAWIRDKLL
jgi:hypothetical protein